MSDVKNKKKASENRKTSPNEELLENIHISSQENTLIKSLDKFYKNKDYMNVMLPIVNGYSKISLRALDWFVTNYSKHKKITYLLKGNNKLFNVHYNYKAQLKAFNKKFFDPFCRGNRIPFFYDKDNCIITTIGQLNFFKWAISNDVVNYVTENLKDIEVDMNKTNKREVKKEKKNLISKMKIKNKKKNELITGIDTEICKKDNSGSTAPIIRMPIPITIRDKEIAAKDLLMELFDISLPKISILFLLLARLIIFKVARANVLVLIPPAVDAGEPPIHIKRIIIMIVGKL